MDLDGRSGYSDVRTVKILDMISMEIYPIPAVDKVNINGWINIKEMKLYDIYGRMISEWNTGSPSLDISKLSKGAYILKMDLKTGEMLQQKIIKN